MTTNNVTLDPADILATLGVRDIHAVSPVQGGSDTAIWRVEHGDHTSALRVFRPEQLATYRREQAAMEAARQAMVTVPEVRAAGIWRERPALLLSWCHGAPLWEVLRKQPLQILALGKAFGRAQAQIHKATPTAELQSQAGRWINWAGADETLQSALQRLARPAPALLHLDYHPLNVLADGTQITAVLDWANARPGDPRADIARTYTILMVEPFSAGRQPLLISIVRRLLAMSWRQGYEQVAGPLTDMAWFYTWAGSVMQRDLARHVENPDSWWQPRHMEQVRQWTARWRERAQLS